MNLHTNFIICLVKISKNDLMTCDSCLRHYHRKCINCHPPVSLTTNISNQNYATCFLCKNRSVFFNSSDPPSNVSYNDVFKNCLYYDDKSLKPVSTTSVEKSIFCLFYCFFLRSLQF